MKSILIMLSMCLTVVFGYHMTAAEATDTRQPVREVTVQAGDTVWDIAGRTAHKDMDVREMVYAMKQINHIQDAGALTPGTVLRVPTATSSDSPIRALDYMAQN